MKKILILIIAIPFFAASCTDIFDFGGGTRGIYKSEDNGETFNLFTKLAPKGDLNNLSVNSLVFDPTNPEILYAGAASGVYKTEDGAKTWKYILSGISVTSISVDKFTPNTIYAAGIAGSNGKIIKSTDGGTAWTDVYTEPSKNNTVLSIAVSSVSSSTVLAGLLNGELIRSTDSGKTWQATKDFSDRVIKIKFGNTSAAYALTLKKGLYSSQDLGVSWQPLTDSMINDVLSSVDKNIISVTAFYDLGLDIKQPGVIYIGAEEGLFRTVNEGKDWAAISLPLKNTALKVSTVTVNPTNSNTLYVSVGSTLYKSINGGLTWEIKTLPSSAIVNTIIINPTSTNIIYFGLKSP